MITTFFLVANEKNNNRKRDQELRAHPFIDQVYNFIKIPDNSLLVNLVTSILRLKDFMKITCSTEIPESS